MFESMDGLDARAALAAVVERRQVADRAEAELLALAAHWADLHAVLAGEGYRLAVPGMECLVRLAGAGTPEVAEFAPAELGAALGITTYAAAGLVGDALELRHRLPRLWARVAEGSVQAWRARKVAEHTRCLSFEAAGWVDAQVVGFAHKVGLKRVLDLVAAAMWRFDPDEAARRVRASREGRGVFVSDQMTNGNRSVAIEADALDVAEFDATVSAIAEALARLGDGDRLAVRRAKAIGVIADPQGALDLLSSASEAAAPGSTASPGDGSTSADRRDDGCGHETPADSGSIRNRPTATASGLFRRGRPVLYIHLSAQAVAAHGGAALARVEGFGAVSVEQVMEWLGRRDMRVQPVIDLADTAGVDAYEAPGRVREIVILRNPCCPFPWCNNLGRRKDMDHVEEYVPPEEGGGAGQTGPDNLSPPCRRHHRLKTHGGWTYQMVEPGMFLWKSPLGQRFLVDQSGTTKLTRPLAS